MPLLRIAVKNLAVEAAADGIAADVIAGLELLRQDGNDAFNQE